MLFQAHTYVFAALMPNTMRLKDKTSRLAMLDGFKQLLPWRPEQRAMLHCHLLQSTSVDPASGQNMPI